LAIALYYSLINFVLHIAGRIIMAVKSREYDYFRRTGMHTYIG